MSWSEERVERLKELWADGMTASQIAKALGGVSRNAVIGKVHRLGLSNRPPPGTGEEIEQEEPLSLTETKKTAKTEKAAKQEARPEDAEQAKKAEQSAALEAAVAEMDDVLETEDETTEETAVETINPVVALAAEVEKSARRLSLLELNERTCKWPIGDPSTSDFYFCGLPCAPGKPYCEAHVAVAYQPMSSRRERDRSRGRAATA